MNLNPDGQPSIPPDATGHEHKWVESYYGWECVECQLFIPFGCEPWMPIDDYEDDYDEQDFDEPYFDDEPMEQP